jgi:hypothetical protein
VAGYAAPVDSGPEKASCAALAPGLDRVEMNRRDATDAEREPLRL